MLQRALRPGMAVRFCVLLTAVCLTIGQLPGASHSALAAATTARSRMPARCKVAKPKGLVKFSDWQFPANLNTYTVSSQVEAYVENAMFEALWGYDGKARLEPQLASQIPTVKNGGIRNNGKTVIVHLKKGNRWSNGSEITSADIKFGFEVGSSKLSGPVCAGSCDIIARIDTPDRYTAVLTLKRPYSPVLAYGMPPIIPTKWKNSVGSWSTPQEAAKLIYQNVAYNYETSDYPTNGPYAVTEFVKDDRVTFHPMKYYRDLTCGASLKSLIFAFYSDKAGLIAAAASHDTDVTGGGGGYTLADMASLRQHATAYKINSVAGFAQEHFEFNLDKTYNGKPNPLASVKVRQALALAFDKLGMTRSALSVSASLAKTIIAWSPWVNTPQLVQPFADRSIHGQWDPIAKAYVSTTGSGKALQDAKKLLSETPYKNGFSLDLVTSAGNPVRAAEAGVIQSNWKRLGVDVSIDFSPADRFFSDWATGSELNHGTFQVALFAFSGSPDPDQIKYDLQSQYVDREKQDHTSPLNLNFAGIHDGAIDKAMNTGASSVSSAVRKAAYTIVQERINQQAYWVPLYYRPTIITYSSSALGVVNNPTQAGPTWNISHWRTSS